MKPVYRNKWGLTRLGDFDPHAAAFWFMGRFLDDTASGNLAPLYVPYGWRTRFCVGCRYGWLYTINLPDRL